MEFISLKNNYEYAEVKKGKAHYGGAELSIDQALVEFDILRNGNQVLSTSRDADKIREMFK
jgi:hypothetical protein